MEYNEEEFKVKANRKARNVWFTLSIILTVSYGSDTSEGIRTGEYYIAFLLMCWIPYLVGLVVLKLKGMAASVYRYVVAVGYGIFILLLCVPRPRRWRLFTYCRLPAC